MAAKATGLHCVPANKRMTLFLQTPGRSRAVSNDEKLKTLQCEVQRLLGRSLLRLQQDELGVKALVALHSISGPADSLETVRDKQIDGTSRKTLGVLVGDFLGSCVVSNDIDCSDEATTGSPQNDNWFTMKTQLGLPNEGLDRLENQLKELVLLRNNLVHHFIEQHDLNSIAGCNGAQVALVAANSSIDRHVDELRAWLKDMTTMQQTLSGILQSKAFQDMLATGVSSDGSVDFSTPEAANVLHEAFGVLAVDGWVRVAEAGRWISKRYPGQSPKQYGCSSWRQVVHNEPAFELRYLMIDGKRSACYRENVISTVST